MKQYLATHLHFGRDAIGAAAAAAAFFGKGIGDLSPAEIALLAALPQQPRALDPGCHPERASKRRAETKLIEPAQFAEASNEPISVLPCPGGCERD